MKDYEQEGYAAYWDNYRCPYGENSYAEALWCDGFNKASAEHTEIGDKL